MTQNPEQAVADTIDYIVAHWQEQPDQMLLARNVRYGNAHFQKLLTKTVGIPPEQLIQFMTARTSRDLSLTGYKTLDAAYRAGLSGNGRLHDALVHFDAAIPAEIMRKGRGLTIYYGFHPTITGDMLIAETARGLCFLGYLLDGERDFPLARLFEYLPLADFVEDPARTRPMAKKIMALWRGDQVHVNLHLYGTNFQLQVWSALMRIPCGAVVSYQAIANAIGKPKASRAVGSAVGANPVSLLIPCHRVIQSTGIVENYGWGTARKRLILGLESRQGG